MWSWISRDLDNVGKPRNVKISCGNQGKVKKFLKDFGGFWQVWEYSNFSFSHSDLVWQFFVAYWHFFYKNIEYNISHGFMIAPVIQVETCLGSQFCNVQ